MVILFMLHKLNADFAIHVALYESAARMFISVSC